MTDFINGFNGDFIYINCNIFPITAFMYKDRKILKQENIYDLKEYVLKIIDLMKIEKLNIKLFKEEYMNVLELIMNEKGIVKISIKGKHYAK